MDDRFKFRFWHKPTQKMMDCYGFNKDFVFGDTLDGVGTEYNPAKIKDCILMQCTGLKDISGTLIYEGDIVRFYFDNDDFIAVITWDNDESRFYLNTTDYFKDKYVTDYEIVKQEEYEVIGNIYENKELLDE